MITTELPYVVVHSVYKPPIEQFVLPPLGHIILAQIAIRDFNCHKTILEYDATDNNGVAHQTDKACPWLVCHSRGGDCANCIRLPRLSGGPATQFFWEASRASPQHGWWSAYSLRETLSPIQDQNDTKDPFTHALNPHTHQVH